MSLHSLKKFLLQVLHISSSSEPNLTFLFHSSLRSFLFISICVSIDSAHSIILYQIPTFRLSSYTFFVKFVSFRYIISLFSLLISSQSHFFFLMKTYTFFLHLGFLFSSNGLCPIYTTVLGNFCRLLLKIFPI
jgi:hypothetical protein